MITTVLTGSASGIGAAIAKCLAVAGHRVIGIDIQKADIVADLTTAAGRRDAVQEALKLSGSSVQHLVCCAGIGPQGEAARVASVNYFGATDLLDAFLPVLQREKNASAVVISSNSATIQREGKDPWVDSPLRGAFLSGNEAEVHRLLAAVPEDMRGITAYMGSKNAVAVAVRLRAAAWGRVQVRLNAVAPGAVETPLLQEGLRHPRFKQGIEAFVPPLGRRAEAGEMAPLVEFLLSDKASYIHGSVIFADGGFDAAVRPLQF